MDENMSRGYIQLGTESKADRLASKRPGGGLSSQPPHDPCQCIYLGLLLAGVGFLLPYNSFIIAVDYFQSRYPATTIVFDMSLVYILVALVAVVVNNVLVETLSLNVRIGFGYVVAFFTLLFVAAFEIWFEVFEKEVGYVVNLVAVAVVAFGCTVQQSSFYGYTSMLPSRYTQAVMTGESAAGLLVSGSRILTKLLLEDERLNTLLFFCVSLVTVLGCGGVHYALQRSHFVRFYLQLCAPEEEDRQAEDMRHIVLEPTEDVGLVDMLDPSETKSGKYGVLSLRSPPASPVTESDAWRTSCESVVPGGGTTYRVQEVVVKMRGTAYTKHIQWWGGIKRGMVKRWEVGRLIWPYMLSIGSAYLVTLSLFPGIESEIVSCLLGSWMPVLLMAAFNLTDFIGKILASISHNWTAQQLLLLSASRVLLVPLLSLCAAPRGAPALPGEGPPLALSLVLGLTNGVAGSVPMILAPSVVSDEHKELTGNIMTLSYMVGLTTGSGIAYLIDFLLGPTILHPCAWPSFENATWATENATLLPDLLWNITILPFANYTDNGTALL